MESALSHFTFAQFQFVLKAQENICLPAYKGSTFRGAFGHAFKRVVCVNREKICEPCLLKGKCVYSYIFETPPPPETLKMRKYPFAPHPFVITPPLEEKRTYRQNEALSFELTLIGKSTDFLPYFIYTFDELGRMGIGKGKGKYQLEEVKAINKNEGEGMIYSGKDKTLRNNFSILKVDDLGPFSVSPLTLRLSFLTPTRLKYDGKLSPDLEFHILFRNLLRRISLLSYFHCGEELNLDFKGLIEEAKDVKVQKENLRWVDWERYSNRQETKMKMGGFIGSVTFTGNFKEFLPFLILGEYIHVGKGTSFGLGKYKILRD
ncbi:MAG: CRISPR-associated protein Cas6 [Deltaproteobacteria bacterium CG_4_8_14_3_um_filter_45_9]|nr:MAG: CRISPR-associated protein Cas6 [Deltaproteobacteria bacterium CG_4_8_14_3_um_filter_45_9]